MVEDWTELKRLNPSWKLEECKFFNAHCSQMYVWSAAEDTCQSAVPGDVPITLLAVKRSQK